MRTDTHRKWLVLLPFSFAALFHVNAQTFQVALVPNTVAAGNNFTVICSLTAALSKIAKISCTNFATTDSDTDQELLIDTNSAIPTETSFAGRYATCAWTSTASTFSRQVDHFYQRQWCSLNVEYVHGEAKNFYDYALLDVIPEGSEPDFQSTSATSTVKPTSATSTLPSTALSRMIAWLKDLFFLSIYVNVVIVIIGAFIITLLIASIFAPIPFFWSEKPAANAVRHGNYRPTTPPPKQEPTAAGMEMENRDIVLEVTDPVPLAAAAAPPNRLPDTNMNTNSLAAARVCAICHEQIGVGGREDSVMMADCSHSTHLLCYLDTMYATNAIELDVNVRLRIACPICNRNRIARRSTRRISRQNSNAIADAAAPTPNPNPNPTVTNNQAAAAAPNENSRECPICLESFDNAGQIVILPCICKYHLVCLQNYFDVGSGPTNQCSHCRTQFDKAVIIDETRRAVGELILQTRPAGDIDCEILMFNEEVR